MAVNSRGDTCDVVCVVRVVCAVLFLVARSAMACAWRGRAGVFVGERDLRLGFVDDSPLDE